MIFFCRMSNIKPITTDEAQGLRLVKLLDEATTLKVENFAGTKFRGSKKPRNFLFFAGIKFRVCTFQVSFAGIKFRGRTFQVSFASIKFRGRTFQVNFAGIKFMISFKNKKAGVKKIASFLAKSSRNVFIHKWLSCLGQNVTIWLYAIQTKARLRSLIGELGDFRILRSLNENPQTLDPDIRTLFANFNTRNERCEKKRSRFLSSAKRSNH